LTCFLQPSRKSLAQDPDCALEFPGLETANYGSQRQWCIWEFIHQSVVEMKLEAFTVCLDVWSLPQLMHKVGGLGPFF